MAQSDATGLAERLRPLVNEILERFNQENIMPREAGLIILALTQRLMSVLAQAPEERRLFIMDFINLVNSYLAGELSAE